MFCAKKTPSAILLITSSRHCEYLGVDDGFGLVAIFQVFSVASGSGDVHRLRQYILYVSPARVSTQASNNDGCRFAAKRARWKNARSCVSTKRVAITSLSATAWSTASIKPVSGEPGKHSVSGQNI